MTRNLKMGVAMTLSLFTMTAGAAMAQNGDVPKVTVNEHPVEFQGQPPIEENGRVLVPLRGVLEQIGAYVEYHADKHLVTAYRGDTHIVLPIGSTQARVGDRDVTLDVPARVMNGSTMVPLRFVAESLGAHVAFHSDSDTVAIWTSGRDASVSSAEMPTRPAASDQSPAPAADAASTLTGSVVSISADQSPTRLTLRIPDPNGGSGTVDRDLAIRGDATFTFQRHNDTQRDITLDHIRRGEQVSVSLSDGGRVSSITVLAPAFDANRPAAQPGTYRGEFQEMRRRPDGMTALQMGDGREIVVPGDTAIRYGDQTLRFHDLRPGDELTITLDPVTHHGTAITINGK